VQTSFFHAVFPSDVSIPPSAFPYFLVASKRGTLDNRLKQRHYLLGTSDFQKSVCTIPSKVSRASNLFVLLRFGRQVHPTCSPQPAASFISKIFIRQFVGDNLHRRRLSLMKLKKVLHRRNVHYGNYNAEVLHWSNPRSFHGPNNKCGTKPSSNTKSRPALDQLVAKKYYVLTSTGPNNYYNCAQSASF